ncbi:MAG: hypothetical protein ACM3ON_12830 [Chloroflexota bacterium]
MPDHRLTALLACLNKLPGSLHIDCPLVSEDPTILAKTPFPFVTVTDADPYARILGGRILTEAGSMLTEVLLLVQRDQYALRRDPLRPVTNRDVEEAWQKAFRAYEKDRRSPLIHVFRPGGLLPPLLYCTLTRLFFPPPCPRCGVVLQQCEDDALLTALGLQPYARSLQRFLFCPDCAKLGVPVFYAFQREASDPPAVRDRFSLIGDFAQVGRQNAGENPFPCPGCPEHGVCYGSGAIACSRIVPFSFYPFNLMIVEAPHLSGLDFLALVSGASLGELENILERKGEDWRRSAVIRLGQQCGGLVSFIAQETGRRFFEVLYLKLSFLYDAYDHVVSSTDPFGVTERGFSADRLWVKLGEAGGGLPFLWNFNLRFVGLRGGLSEESAIPSLPASNEFVSLGLLWFCALLANGRHDMNAISRSLMEAVRSRTLTEAMPTEDPFGGEKNPFTPENIFWQPGGVIPDESWRHLWERTIGLGWSLLRAAAVWDEKWLMREFRQRLESLREDVKEALFRARSAAAEAVVSPGVAEAEAIRSTLVRIAGKWQAAVEAEKAELAETVILSTTFSGIAPAEAQPHEVSADTSLTETVVLGPGGVVPAEKNGIAASRSPEGERPSPSQEEVRREAGRTASPSPSADDLLVETVIISRGARPQLSPESRADGIAEEGSPTAKPDSDLSAKPIKKASADDDLAQTIIIDPAKRRSGK